MEINATLFGQLITFAILVWFTMKYVWPPITQGMREREMKIAAGLEAAEQGKRELAQAEHAALALIHQARQEATQLVDQAHKRSAQMLEDVRLAARNENQRILEQAQEEIKQEITRAKEALKREFASLAIASAEKIIKRNLDAAAHTDLLNEFISQL